MNWTSDVGWVFNVERCAIEDGPGIRTVVFLKGCGLRCRWCANPESQAAKPEILLNPNLCVQCGRCQAVCPHGRIAFREGFGYVTSGPCEDCDLCIRQCFCGARKVMGVPRAPEELCEALLRDKPYFDRSGGGVTFSGGEPLLQVGFVERCAALLKARGVPVLVETCGHVPPEAIRRLATFAQAVYYDVKHMDSDTHKALTGQSNQLILDNLRLLSSLYLGPISVRYPFIPGCNSDETDIRKFLDFCAGLPHVTDVWFLPYHRLGLAKYTGLGRAYPMGDLEPLKSKDLEYLQEYAQTYGFPIHIG